MISIRDLCDVFGNHINNNHNVTTIAKVKLEKKWVGTMSKDYAHSHKSGKAQRRFSLWNWNLKMFHIFETTFERKKLFKWSFFKPLERFWRVNIKSGLASCIFSFEMQVTVKRTFGSQIALDHTNVKNDQMP